MKKNLVKKAAVALSMTAIISSQTLSVCAAPVNDFSAVGKDNLLRYYEENFDVAKYKATYKDLRDAFGENANDSMYLKHYLEHGMYEGRKSDGFDAVAFILNNYDYFTEHGMDAKFPFFDVVKYKSEYPDLQAVFGDDLSLYLNHYLNHGIFEDRKSGGEIDIISVAKKYPDIKITTNMDLTSADVLVQVEKQVKVEEQKAADAIEAAKVAAQPTASTSSGSTTTADSGNNSSSTDYDNNGSSNSGNNGSTDSGNSGSGGSNEEDKVTYDEDAYNEAVAIWQEEEPDKDAYLAAAGYDTAYTEWEAAEPDKNDYLSEEGQAAYTEWEAAEPDKDEYLAETEYATDYAAWKALEPSPEDEKYSVGYPSEDAANAAYEADYAAWEEKEPKQEDYLTEQYATDYATWEESEPNAEDYTYDENGYANKEAATDAYNEALTEWEKGKPAKQTEDELQVLINAYKAENAEPQKTAYPYYEDGYASNSDAEAAYEADKKKWDESQDENKGDEPQKADYLAKVNIYESQNAATDAFNTAYAKWEAGMPVAETEEEYNARVAAWEAENADTKPVESDYTSKVNKYESADAAKAAYAEAVDAWRGNEPEKSDYYDEDKFNTANSEYEAAKPQKTDEKYALGNYETEELAEAAYEADLAEWEALEPQEEDYLTDYNAAVEAWRAGEPQLEDFVIQPDGSVG